eukprot:1794529-Pyramimonas_sp.AAC.1
MFPDWVCLYVEAARCDRPCVCGCSVPASQDRGAVAGRHDRHSTRYPGSRRVHPGTHFYTRGRPFVYRCLNRTSAF